MHRGVIAAGSQQSAGAGAEVFDLGGNAVDAAIAAAFATAAGDPAITSLAGGGILVHRDGATGRTAVCDFFASAPGLGGRRSSRDASEGLPPLDFFPLEIRFEDNATTQTFHIGRAAAAVPGALHGLCAARDRWGSLPLSVLVAPAVRYLREGVALTEYQVKSSSVLLGIIRRSRLGRELFFDTGGRPLAAGARFRNRRLAETLERLAGDGLERLLEEVFVPALLDDFGEERGGRLTREDLARYRPDVSAGCRVTYRDVRIVSGTASSFGGPFIARTLELFRKARLEETAPRSADRFLRLGCVFRAISEARAAVHDLTERPDALEILWKRAEELLAGSREPPRSGEPRLPGNTTHISTLDSRGNAASLTLSHGEGNGHAIGETGILMNNLLGEADLFPRGLGRFTPGERLKTMMAPTIMEASSGVVTVLGAGGSNRIRTAIPQVISALVDDGVDPRAAIEGARIHYEDGVLSAEAYLLEDPARALSHVSSLARESRSFATRSLFFGGVHLARDSGGRLEGFGDPRRGGVVCLV